MADMPHVPPGQGGVFSTRVPHEVPAIVPIRFWTEYGSADPQTNEIVGEDWVEWAKKGESGQTTNEKIARLIGDPDSGRPAALEWPVIEPYYKAWKAAESYEGEGTPLAAWPGVPRQLADALKKQRVATVEDFAQMPDHNLSKVPFQGIREMRDKARAYVDNKPAAGMAFDMAESRRQLEEQKQELAAVKEQIALLKGSRTVVTADEKDIKPVENAPEHFLSGAATGTSSVTNTRLPAAPSVNAPEHAPAPARAPDRSGTAPETGTTRSAPPKPGTPTSGNRR